MSYPHDRRGMHNYNKNHSSSSEGPRGSFSYDEPPNSRLFIVCGRSITEENFREAFSRYGKIEEVWIVKDRTSGEPKGITYIKFSKTSEAALAMEEMNGRVISGSPRPLKVLIAHSRDQGSRREPNEDERLVRLFVVVNKTMSENELHSYFSKYGDIDYVSIVRDRNTKESKGFAYVKYHRMYHAAKAFEECDRIFKPVFAEPKPQRGSHQEQSGSYGGSGSSSGYGQHQQMPFGVNERFQGPGSTASGSTAASMNASFDLLSYMDNSQVNQEGICSLLVCSSATLNQDQIWKLFDLVPGLDFCELSRSGAPSAGKNIFYVVYNNPQSATYAKEKLHGFEYPPGQRLIVRYERGFEGNASGPPVYPKINGPPSNQRGPQGPPIMNSAPGPQQPTVNIQNNIAHLKETIANATALLQAAGYGSGSGPSNAPPTGNTNPNGETYDPSYCSVKLPPPQPLASMDSPVAERLFIVCLPVPPQLFALKDVFGRFGNLIDVYLLNGKNCGYAKYANKASADKAVSLLHGQEICGSRLKVMLADPRDKDNNAGDPNRKRPKMAEEHEAN